MVSFCVLNNTYIQNIGAGQIVCRENTLGIEIVPCDLLPDRLQTVEGCACDDLSNSEISPTSYNFRLNQSGMRDAIRKLI